MKAAVFQGPGEPLMVQDVRDPDPGPGEVVLRVERCGICASDLHMTTGHAIGYRPGSILGHEVGAEVVALGRGVERVKVGDFVVPMPARGCERCLHCLLGRPGLCLQVAYNVGGYAQYMLSSAASCVPVAGGLSLADAALVEPLTVGLHGVSSAPVRPGDRVLVLGAGPIGLAAVFWAERCGARVVVAARSNRREALARSMGAHGFAVMSEGYKHEVRALLGGEADVVIECVGAPGLIAAAVPLVKTCGTIVVLGLCVHIEPLVPAFALFKEVRIQFAIGTQARQFRAAIDALAADAVKPRAMVTDTIPLDELPAMFEALRQRTTQCKVLVNP